MIGNYQTLPPSYISSFIPMNKAYCAYMTNSDLCIIEIGDYDKDNNTIKVDEKIYIQRNGVEWVVTNRMTPSYTYMDNEFTHPYYVYSDCITECQINSNICNIRTSYFTKLTFMTVLFWLLLISIIRLLKR